MALTINPKLLVLPILFFSAKSVISSRTIASKALQLKRKFPVPGKIGNSTRIWGSQRVATWHSCCIGAVLAIASYYSKVVIKTKMQKEAKHLAAI